MELSTFKKAMTWILKLYMDDPAVLFNAEYPEEQWACRKIQERINDDCVCVCVCLFSSTVEASHDWNKTINVIPEIRPVMLRWENHFVSITFITIS